MIDIRSDTVTQPTEGMRKAMLEAEVGDDVLGDDPTVIKLQNKAAELLGKETALYVPSGTMSNIVATRTHTSPGDEIVTEAHSHIYRYEGGAFAALSGCSVALVDGKNGLMTSEQVSSSIRKAEGSLSHYPNGSLVCVENTAQGGGGSVYSQEAIDDICKVAREKDCKLHMDGARLFNASVASNTDPARMVRDFDSISICLSKGLGAPIGSVLVGSKEDLAQAHRWRKMFGGGMRQAGMMAAAGIYALENNIDRLREDHRRARKFAEALVEMPNFSVNLDTVQSNIVYIGVGKGRSKQMIEKLAKQDIDILDTDDSTIRAVFHLHIGDEDLEKIIEVFAQLR
ncbi:MAG: GntG family PLP-dependent aldolase [Candidatus Thermoplasmatota archaeon]|nr:GntG family PLP-dependent aldolase [Candidatus Thermoplasmatota archaeon]MEE3082061.1 GntG family PLP-dependent aldolase [Candidatus Thermoplasmatota archaeon]